MSSRTSKGQAQKAKVVEKKIGSVSAPPISEVESWAKSQRYITPYLLSERFGVRLSVAKDVLSGLERKGVISLVSGSNRIRIYAPTELLVQAAKAEEAEERPKPARRRKKRKEEAQA